MIRLCGLTKRYGEVLAVDRVTLAIGSGEAVVVEGPSGSGKTTLLRLIAGLELPDDGEIVMDGEQVSSPGWASAPHGRGLGFVFQRSALWPHMTVAQNVAFPLQGWSRGDAAQRVREMLEAVGLEDLAGRYPAQLSGGEARRVALARAVAARPRRLLLDEPLSNLDPALRDSMVELIWKLQAQTGATLVLVSHESLPTAPDGIRVVTLRKGRVAGDDVTRGTGTADGREAEVPGGVE